MPLHLNESSIGAAIRQASEVGRRDLSDRALPGLRLRIAVTGRAGWILACRDQHGRMRRFSLGEWPRMGIKEAREAARSLRVDIRNGYDPVAERRQNRAIGQDAKVGIGTLTALLDLYERKVGTGIKSWPISKRRVEVVFAGQLKRPLSVISRIDLQIAIDGYGSQLQARGAAHCLRPVLRWAAARHYVAAELIGLEVPAKPRRRERVLDEAELRALLPVLRCSTSPYALAMRVMLLTLMRREEVCGARWRDIDLRAGTWRIDAGRAKNRVEHRVPMPQQVLDLLKAI